MTCWSQALGFAVRKPRLLARVKRSEALQNQLPDDPFAELFVQARFGRMAPEALLMAI
jgi:hypothetical protein